MVDGQSFYPAIERLVSSFIAENGTFYRRARILGIGLNTLRRKLKAYGVK